MAGSGRNLSMAVKNQVKENQETTKPQVEQTIKKAKDKEGQKKEGKSFSLRRQNIESMEEFLHEFNYENRSNISMSETLDSLIEMSLSSNELKKNLLKKIK